MGPQYYTFISELLRFVSDPLADLSYNMDVPILAALVLGLLGATSPCQLSTNVAALAYVSRRVDRGGAAVRAALAYLDPCMRCPYNSGYRRCCSNGKGRRMRYASGRTRG